MSFPNLKATDLDGDRLTYTFSPPLDSSGRWLTKKGDAGTYHLTIMVSDGKTSASQRVEVVVLPLNRAPVISPIRPITVNEGQTIVLHPKINDPDGDEVFVSIAGWQSHFPYKTTFEDQGAHSILITASDRAFNTTSNVSITVNNINRPPRISALPDSHAKEGEKITVRPTASDPDNDPLTITFSKPFSKEGMFEPRVGDAGSYMVTVTASDGALSATERFTLTVSHANLPPQLFGVQDLSVREGETLSLDVAAKDPENQTVAITYSGFMTSPSRRMGYSDAGIHEVTVKASDGENTVSGKFTVTVSDVNRAPVFNEGSFG